MPRVPRNLTLLPDFAVHKVWRGHNKEPNLGTRENKLKYLEFLNADIESKRFGDCSTLHALTLMTTHTHESGKVKKPVLYSNHMRRHHSRYGIYFNKVNGRSGKGAEDRPHTTLIEGEHAEMETVFYIHANPVRAGIVRDARDYHWSTHRLYAFGKREPWMLHITFPTWYLKLGRTWEQRQKNYRRLFAKYLKERGSTKQTFLKKRFFGSLVWMDQQEALVKSWRAAHRGPP
jgi:putative transposase